MITTDMLALKQVSRETSIEECRFLKIFETLDMELQNSARPGIGLTAVQVGRPIRACIIRIKHPDGRELKLNMVNPYIIENNKLFIFANEGCLSIPDKSINTDRYDEIFCHWIDYDTGNAKKAVFTGLEAVCIQQEIDHMSGLTILDREHKKEEKIGRNEKCPECLKNGIEIKYKKCKLHQRKG